MDFRFSALGQARRILLLQGRLRSNEPTQILVCAAFGGLIGATTIGLHRLVDVAHTLIFNILGGHTLSSGLGIDPQRLLIVPALGGLILGISVMIMRRVRPTDVVDPIEADALSKLGAQYAALYRTEDFVEGRRAEAEGRPPKYLGK